MTAESSLNIVPYKAHKPMLYTITKRLFDFVCSAIGLMMMAIPYAIIAIAIKIDSPGPIVFRQQRMGRHGKPFTCYKFRSMYITAPHDCAASNLKDRKKLITKVGMFLRKTSLDETLQLINIFRGDMSFIGPRPLVLTETKINSHRMRLGIYEMRPGLSGLAQISGRNFVTDEEKVLLDLEYLHKASFSYDMLIVLKTILYVLCRKDIYDD